MAEPVECYDPVAAGALPAGSYVTLLHVGPYSSDSVPDLGDARERLVRWTAERGIVYGRATERGSALACCVEHLRIGPVDDADWTKWETELAWLAVER